MPKVAHIEIDREQFRRIIFDLGLERAGLAQRCGVTLDGLNYWLRSGRIPLQHWKTITDLLKDKGLDTEPRSQFHKDMEIIEQMKKDLSRPVDFGQNQKWSLGSSDLKNHATEKLVSELERRGYAVTLSRGISRKNKKRNGKKI